DFPAAGDEELVVGREGECMDVAPGWRGGVPLRGLPRPEVKNMKPRPSIDDSASVIRERRTRDGARAGYGVSDFAGSRIEHLALLPRLDDDKAATTLTEGGDLQPGEVVGLSDFARVGIAHAESVGVAAEQGGAVATEGESVDVGCEALLFPDLLACRGFPEP